MIHIVKDIQLLAARHNLHPVRRQQQLDDLVAVTRVFMAIVSWTAPVPAGSDPIYRVVCLANRIHAVTTSEMLRCGNLRGIIIKVLLSTND